MSKKCVYGFISVIICSILFACSPSPEQLDLLRTQVAGVVYSTQTESAEKTQNVPSTTESRSTTTTMTPTETQQPLVAQPVSPVIALPGGTDGYPWWNDSVFYEIYVRSFYDSDGDGIGDLNGITEKLDYLNDSNPETTTDLGVTGLWLMPIFQSNSAHGYNVTNFYDVNPEYGTMEDFEVLLDAAHARGIRIILDISLNVTSNDHLWFIEGLNPASPYHDWYIWSDHDPGFAGSWGQQVWFPVNGRYLYSTYSPYSPDLNLENPQVTEEMYNVTRFWLEEVGVDGFRLDSAKHMIEEGEIQANSHSTHDWWQEFFAFFKGFKPDAMTVAEVWDETLITASYIEGEECDISFEFWLAGAMIESVNAGDAGKVSDQIRLSYTEIPEMRFGTFLTNHDMDRVMSQLLDDDNKMKAAASLLLTAPGVPFIYYGEEIGMQGDQSHDWVRRPMQWSDELNGGFSTGSPWQPLGPAWDSYNVSDELDDEESILSHYQELIRIRSEHAALRVGRLDVLTTTDEAVYSILRVSEDEAVLVLINLGSDPVENVWIASDESLLPEGNYSPVPILGDDTLPPIEIKENGALFHLLSTLELAPYETNIYQLQP